MKKLKFILIILISFLVVDSLAQDKTSKYPINGFYVTLNGDTVSGNLKNKNQMYLIYRNTGGKKKQFMPSQIRSYSINGLEFLPMYLPDIKKKRFAAVIVNGTHMLYLYNDGTPRRLPSHEPSSPLGAVLESGLTAYGTEEAFNLYHSGYYLTKPGDPALYSVPSSNKLIKKFFEEQVGYFPAPDENDCEKYIDCMKDIVITMNSNLY